MVGMKSRKKYRFQLLAGRHAEGRAPRPRPDGTMTENTQHVYKWNEPGNSIIETDIDLATKFNAPGAEKFRLILDDDYRQSERVPQQPTTTATPGLQVQPTSPPIPTNHPRPVPPGEPKAPTLKDLESLSLKELQALAEEEEVDLKGASRKEDAIRVLRGVFKV